MLLLARRRLRATSPAHDTHATQRHATSEHPALQGPSGDSCIVHKAARQGSPTSDLPCGREPAPSPGP
jgi:hypothetical protein